MRNVIITIKVGSRIDRTALERLNSKYNTVEELLDAIDVDGRILYAENNIQVWCQSDFMDAWNNTDFDSKELTIGDSWIGFSKLKNA